LSFNSTRLSLLKGLLKHGLAVDSETDTGDEEKTALNVPASKGHVAIVDELLSAGANVDGRERSGKPPLVDACANGRVEVVRRLLAAGANANARHRRRVDPRFFLCLPRPTSTNPRRSRSW
jgi:uncharacterized protein